MIKKRTDTELLNSQKHTCIANLQRVHLLILLPQIQQIFLTLREKYALPHLEYPEQYTTALYDERFNIDYLDKVSQPNWRPIHDNNYTIAIQYGFILPSNYRKLSLSEANKVNPYIKNYISRRNWEKASGMSISLKADLNKKLTSIGMQNSNYYIDIFYMFLLEGVIDCLGIPLRSLKNRNYINIDRLELLGDYSNYTFEYLYRMYESLLLRSGFKQKPDIKMADNKTAIRAEQIIKDNFFEKYLLFKRYLIKKYPQYNNYHSIYSIVNPNEDDIIVAFKKRYIEEQIKRSKNPKDAYNVFTAHNNEERIKKLLKLFSKEIEI